MDLGQVRGVAATWGYQEVYFNELAGLISFEPQANLPPPDPGALALPPPDPSMPLADTQHNGIRLDVFYHTGATTPSLPEQAHQARVSPSSSLPHLVCYLSFPVTGTVCLTLLTPPEGSGPIRRFFPNASLADVTIMMKSRSLALFTTEPLDNRLVGKKRKLGLAPPLIGSKKGAMGGRGMDVPMGGPPLPHLPPSHPPHGIMGGGGLPPPPPGAMVGGGSMIHGTSMLPDRPLVMTPGQQLFECRRSSPLGFHVAV